MTGELDRLTVRRLAAHLLQLVEHHHPHRWDPAGLEAHLARMLAAGQPVHVVLTAACQAADDPTARTPAAMLQSRYHRPPTVNREPTGITCRSCGQPEWRCRALAEKFGTDHQFEPVGSASERR